MSLATALKTKMHDPGMCSGISVLLLGQLIVAGKAICVELQVAVNEAGVSLKKYFLI